MFPKAKRQRLAKSLPVMKPGFSEKVSPYCVMLSEATEAKGNESCTCGLGGVVDVECRVTYGHMGWPCSGILDRARRVSPASPSCQPPGAKS